MDAVDDGVLGGWTRKEIKDDRDRQIEQGPQVIQHESYAPGTQNMPALPYIKKKKKLTKKQIENFKKAAEEAAKNVRRIGGGKRKSKRRKRRKNKKTKRKRY